MGPFPAANSDCSSLQSTYCIGESEESTAHLSLTSSTRHSAPELPWPEVERNLPNKSSVQIPNPLCQPDIPKFVNTFSLDFFQVILPKAEAERNNHPGGALGEVITDGFYQGEVRVVKGPYI